MKHFELSATTQKSYYRKAFVYEDADSVFLKSYETIVCGIVNGQFVRFWSDYSVTTMNHINDFLRLYNLPTLNKKAWLNIPVTKCPLGFIH